MSGPEFPCVLELLHSSVVVYRIFLEDDAIDATCTSALKDGGVNYAGLEDDMRWRSNYFRLGAR